MIQGEKPIGLCDNMKPKTFTYNQIIQFFTKHGLPLSERQLHLITEYNRYDNAKIEETRKRQEAKREGKRYRRKMEKQQDLPVDNECITSG
jgi:hypothetical protein